MTPTLLLADHSVTIQRVIELTFAEEDVRVVAVADGRAAIDRIRAAPPDIVLADVGTPERDGYDVAAFVKSSPELSHIPVLLLTGAFERLDEARARSLGVDGVLIKPFEPHVVIERVRELLARRGAAARLGSAEGGAEAASSPSRGTEPGGQAPPASSYLDRLDAAIAAMAAAPRPSGPPSDSPTETLIDQSAQAAVTSPAGPATPSLAEAFAALLAAEQGKPLPHGAPLPPLVLSETSIDEIVRRVIARLGDEPMRQAVLDTAERLVREEIERIKGRRGAQH